MFEVIPVNDERVFAFRATGKLTHADYQAFLPQLEALIERHGRISVLLELDGFHGWEWQAMQDDFQFGIGHRDAFERIALVGDSTWQHAMALLAKPFVDGEVRYFERSESAAAWDWLQQRESA